MKNTGSLKVELRGDREIVMTRVFDAPTALVIEALTTPDLVKRWFGPHGFHLVVCEIDFRIGGAWLYTMRRPDGTDMTMRGTYVEISPNRMVHTERFDDFPQAGEAVVTQTFVEQDGKTTMTQVVRAPDQMARDGMFNSGMEHGAAESYDKLAGVLAVRR